MERITREAIQAREVLTACGYDMREALERVERARDAFFIARQPQRVHKCEMIIKELRKGACYV